MSLAQRRTSYATASSSLTLFSDQHLRELVDTAVPLRAGIGGTTARLDIDGVLVFAKSVSLTDLEQRPENVMSTTNLFELPTCCHYGIGSPGFGVHKG